ncbi:amidohydrolase family protein [Fonticella tunisiensis]|uniref:Putative selenium metabolism protein SsnA n=1 Tax=Fonticella tunisiensis TaxID=1096341 RepID=A0A4R7KXC0_9CLOT|nr:amidohydrolase family protein [Fonticella tunisiensis]TDT63660.1 putative selenium metabolism protein SsnA [Fonticella tunisiensis]
MKALINANIYDFVSFRENCYILFDSEIRETGNMKDFKGADEVIDCRGCIVMPGLINCHTHIYSIFSRGMSVPFNPKNFRDILEQLWWKLDRQLDKEAVYYSGLVYGIDCIKNGVTSLIDHHASGLCIKGSLEELKKAICDELGIRGIFCFETSDRFNVDECIEENMEFARRRTEYHAGLFGLHASMSLSDESLKKISSKIESLPVHIHVAESMDDVDDCIEKYNKRIVNRLEDFGLLNKNSILSHCVHLTEDEARVIKNRECFVALNPTSNMNNAVGLGDYDMLRRNGVKCLIGNDGLGANLTRDYLNIVFAMRNRLKSPIKFSLDDLIQIIRNGYEYVGKILNIKIGRIKKGYKADIVALPYIPPTPMDGNNASGHMFFGVFDNFRPKDVWISGKQLLRNYKPIFNEESIFSKAKEESLKVWGRVNKN